MNWLFDTSLFMKRSDCGHWSEELRDVYIAGNLIIMFSYYMIPLLLFYIWRKKRVSFDNHWILVLFASFIFLCGTTHLLDVLTFIWPAYRFITLVDLLTGFVSLITAILLIPVVRFVLTYKTPKEYLKLQIELEERIKEEQEIVNQVRDINHELAGRVQYLENTVEYQGWMNAQHLKLGQLKHIVERLRDTYRSKVRDS